MGPWAVLQGSWGASWALQEDPGMAKRALASSAGAQGERGETARNQFSTPGCPWGRPYRHDL